MVASLDSLLDSVEARIYGSQQEAQQPELDDFDSMLSKVEARLSAPKETPELGFLSEIGTALAGGAYDTAEMYARAGRVMGMDTTDAIENIKASKQGYEPTRKGPVWDAITGGIRSTVQSIGGGVPGAAVGALGGPAGAVGGFALGAGTLFSLAEYDQFLEEAEAQGIPREAVHDKAIISAIAEGGIEAATDILGAKIFGLAAKKAISEPIKQGLLRSLGKLGKKTAQLGAVEVPGEMATSAIQARQRQEAGLPTPEPGEAALQAIGPSAVQTMIMGPLAGGAQAARRNVPREKPTPSPDIDWDAAIARAREAYNNKELNANQIEALKKQAPPVYALELDAIINDHIFDRLGSEEDTETVIREETPIELVNQWTRSMGEVEDVEGAKYVSARKRPVEQRVTESIEVPPTETEDMRTPMAQLTGALQGKKGRWVDERGGLIEETGPTREEPKVEPSVEVEPTETPGMGTSTVFDETTTDTSHWDNLMKKGEAQIVRMSPDDYMNQAAQIQGITTEDTLRAVPENLPKEYADRMKKGEKAPLPILDYVEKSQEGRARALAAKELGIKEIPVLIRKERTQPKQVKKVPKNKAKWFALGRDVNLALPRETGLKPSDADIDKAASLLGIHKSDARKAWEVFSFDAETPDKEAPFTAPAAPPPKPETKQVEQGKREAIPFNDLPDSAKGAIASDARGRNEPASAFADSQWITERVSLDSLKKENASVWTDRFTKRGSMTKGPLIVDEKGTVLDGNNRLREAIDRGDTEINILRRKGKPTAKADTPDLLPAITSLQRPGQPRELVSTEKLRDKFPDLSKEEFDKAVFDLAKQDKVALHHHDFPSSLTPEKREKMPKDDRGKYVVGVVPVEKAVEKAKESWEMTKEEFKKSPQGKQIADYTKKTQMYPGRKRATSALRYNTWQMQEDAHRIDVKQALSEGKSVPPEVLADYPDLKKEAPREEAKAKTEALLSTRKRVQKQIDDRLAEIDKQLQSFNVETEYEHSDEGDVVPDKLDITIRFIDQVPESQIRQIKGLIEERIQLEKASNYIDPDLLDLSDEDADQLDYDIGKTSINPKKLADQKRKIQRALENIAEGKDVRLDLSKLVSPIPIEYHIKNRTGYHSVTYPDSEEAQTLTETVPKEKAEPGPKGEGKPGRAWIKDQWRPITSARELSKGKKKGWVEVESRGKKYVIDKSKVKEWPGEEEKAPVEVKETKAGPEVSVDLTKSEEKRLTLKEQKEYLIAEIDKAIEEAPENIEDREAMTAFEHDRNVTEAEAEELKKRLYKDIEKPTREELEAFLDENTELEYGKGAQAVNQYVAKLDTNPNYVTIEVPGDGKFRILNRKAELREFKKRAGQFPISHQQAKTPTVSMPQPSAAKKETIGLLTKIIGKYDGSEWFTDGHILIRGTPPKTAKFITETEAAANKGTSSIQADHIKDIIPGKSKLHPARILFFAFEDADTGYGISTSPVPKLIDDKNRITQFVVVESKSGNRAVFNQGLFNAVRNRYPNAKFQIEDSRWTHQSPLVASEEGKIVGIVMPMRDVLHSDILAMAEKAGYIKPEKTKPVEQKPEEVKAKAEPKKPLTRTLSFEDLNRHVDRIVKKWKGAPDVNIVESIEVLPYRVREVLIDAFPDQNARIGIRGLFVGYSDETKPDVFLIAENLATTNEAEKTILHEVIGHYGVRRAFGKSPALDRFYKNLYFAKQKQVDKMLQDRPAYRKYDVTTPEGRMKAADEWFAREVAEKGIEQDPWLKRQWDRFVQILNDALRALGFQVKLSDAEIRQVLRASVKAVTEGPSKGIQVSSVSAAFYHGTPSVNLEKIKRQGLWSNLRERNDWEEGDRTPREQELIYFETAENQNWGGKKSVQLRIVDEDMLPRGVRIEEDQLRPGEFYAYHVKNEPFEIPPEAIEYFDTKTKEWKALVEPAEISGMIEPMTKKPGKADITTQKPQAVGEGRKLIVMKGIDGKFFEMPKKEYDYGDWYITGLEGKKKKIDASRPMWVSKDEIQAEYFANQGKGTIVYSKPKRGSKILDLTDDNVLIEFSEEINRLAKEGHAEFNRIVNEYLELGAKDISEVIHPDDIVEYGKMWDDDGFISSVWETFKYDFVRTHDGGIFLNPDAAWISKNKPLNYGKTSESPNLTGPREGGPDIAASIQSPEEWAKQFVSQFQKAPETKAEEKFDEEHKEDTLQTFETFGGFLKARKRGWKPQKEDTHWLHRIFSVPLHHFRKVPALGRLFQDGLNRMDNYYSYLNTLTQGPDKKYHTVTIDNFRKQDGEGFKKFQKYLVDRDRNQIGFEVKKNKQDQYELYLGQVKKGTYATEEEAWEGAIQKEVSAYRESRGDQAADALLAFRRITHNGFRILMKNMRDIIEKFEANGIPLPEVAIKVEGGKTAKVDLKMALAKMGDMRGYYFPRIRKAGQYMLTAKKKDANPIMEFFDTETFLTRRQIDLEKQGYAVTKDLSPKMPEDVFQMAGEVIAMQATINSALERIHTEGLTLENFGLEFVDRTVKGGTRDFVVRGPSSKRMNEVFKDFGGKWYAAFAGEERMWHFINPGRDFQKRLSKALANQVGILDQETDLLFAKTLAEQVANVIKARGHRAHMIERSDAKGLDVWTGYEEDPALAIAQYARGIAAGEAKKNMALDMVKHFTGTDISWAEYKQDKTDAGEEPDYEEYAKMVNERRIHPTDQRNAFKEGKVFMEDMLRNQEHIDRVMGIVKGLSVLKYLGFRVAAPAVNLTALATSAPAAISGYTKTSISNAMLNIGKAAKVYTQYLLDKKGKGLISKQHKELFEEIEDKGWDKAQYNREALSVLESRVGRHWGNLIERSMWMFGKTEQLNRVSTIAGAYFAIKESTPANEFVHETALEKAKDISDKSHGVYNRANMPHWARGSGIAPQIAKSFYIFKTFSHNYLLTMIDLGFNEKQAGAALYMAISPMILAGSGALVGKQIITAIMESLGIGGDDPEETLYQWVYDNAGERGERLVRHGLFGVPGVNLKGSLEIGITDIPTSIADVLGAPGSLFEDLYYGGKSLARGDIMKGLEKMPFVPNALGSVSRAVRERTEGVTTGTNAPVFYGTKPLVSDTVEAIYRGLSFNPSRIAGIREKQWKEREIEQKYSKMRTDIYAKAKRFYLKPSASRNQAEWIDILNEMNEYNERVMKNKLNRKGIPIMTGKMLNNNIRRAFKPSKRERLREVEEETED